MKHITLYTCLIFFWPVVLAGQKSFKQEIKQYRKTYKQNFLNAPQSPLDKKGVKRLAFFKPNTDFLIKASFSPAKDAQAFKMATSTGELQDYILFGTLQFQLNGKPFSLEIYRNLRTIRLPIYRDRLFLPFKDLSNGKDTYAGGRYLDFKIGDIKNGSLELDFNRAYNPYCVYKESYSCPIPPQANHLKTRIAAGEKNYKGKRKLNN